MNITIYNILQTLKHRLLAGQFWRIQIWRYNLKIVFDNIYST